MSIKPPVPAAADYRHETTLKLGENRGNRRVWIEGGHLTRAGFSPASKFKATFAPNCIVLELATDGDRTVSSRTRDGKPLPIIDMNAAQVGEVLGDTSRIAVKLTKRRIEITPSRIAGMIAARVMTAVAIGAFVGGGLLSQAAKEAGFRTVAANEISEQFSAVHENNHGGQTLNSCISEADLHAVKARVGPVGLFHAGIPCEPYSVIRLNAGNAKADRNVVPEAHELGDMTFWTLRAVDILNPHTVVLEEVPKWLESGSGYMARHVLTRLGYTVDARVIDSADLGAVTSRKRAYMVATAFPVVRWPEPVRATQTLGELLHAPEDPRCEWFTRETKGWLFNHWDKQAAKGNGFKRGTVVHYSNTHISTIKKRYFAGQGDNQVVAHPTRPDTFRWLTIDGVKAIMGLPAHYDLGSAKTTAGEIIGQGVEVGALARIIRSVTTA